MKQTDLKPGRPRLGEETTESNQYGIRFPESSAKLLKRDAKKLTNGNLSMMVRRIVEKYYGFRETVE